MHTCQVTDELSTESDVISTRIDELRSVELPRIDDLDDLFELLERSPELYLAQSIEMRARMLQMVTSNCRVSRDSIVPVYKKPFSGIATGLETGKWWVVLDSNQRLPD